LIVSIPFTGIRVGAAARYGSLTVFPLFCDEKRPVDYVISDEAMEAGTVTVGEMSQEGRVPELVVINKSHRRVLFLEGEQLLGAKQNRILNTSVLVPANAALRIPVSCVEQGRWSRARAFFAAGKNISPYKLRGGLKRSVTRSLHDKLGHRSDQRQVWDEVREQQAALRVASPTGAMADTYQTYAEQVAETGKALPYVPGACGLAVAIGPQVVTADLFDKPATCEKVWGKLLSGLVLDALLAEQDAGQPQPAQADEWLGAARKSAWVRTDAAGEGQELRSEFSGNVASALVLEESLVHGSVVALAGSGPVAV
jgi:ARG and Rhodanese-Phosphatase-superfamily-associated Protein domain